MTATHGDVQTFWIGDSAGIWIEFGTQAAVVCCDQYLSWLSGIKTGDRYPTGDSDCNRQAVDHESVNPMGGMREIHYCCVGQYLQSEQPRSSSALLIVTAMTAEF